MIPLIALLTASLGVQQLQTVNYTTVAIPLQRALREIGKQTHHSLETGGDIGKQPIIIHVAEAPLKELLERIATVESGRWTNDRGTLYLSFDRRKLNASQERLHAERARMFATQLSTMENGLKEEGELTPEKAHAIADDSRAMGLRPEREYVKLYLRALHEILVGLGADLLADIRPCETVVYSTDPTPTQEPMAELGQFVLNEYLNSEQIWRQTFPPARATDQGEIGAASITRLPGTRITVVINEYVGSLHATIHVEPSPATPDTASTSFFEQYGRAVQPTLRLDTPPDHRPIELSEEARWLLAKDQTLNDDELQSIPDGLGLKLEHPDQFDPLSWGPSEFLIGVAQRQQLQLVANLPDSSSRLHYDIRASKPLQTSFLEVQSKVDTSLDIKKDRNWLLVSPVDAVGAIENRTDRSDLAVMVHNLNPQSPDNIEVLAKYDSKHPGQDHGLAHQLRSYLFGDVEPNEDGTASWTSAFYGGLSVGQQSRLLAGGALNVGDLGEPAMAALRELVFEHEASVYGGADESSTWSEPSEPLTEGIIKLDVSHEPVIQFKVPKEYGHENSGALVRQMTAEQTGYEARRFLFNIHRPFTYLDRRVLSFEVTFQRGITCRFSLCDHYLSSSPPKTWAALPAEFKNKVAESKTHFLIGTSF